jgi:HKD family nuclease
MQKKMLLLLISLTAQVFFSPNGGAKEAILKELTNAKNNIDVAMYILTDRELTKALVSAKERGVKVRVLLDMKSTEEIEYSKHLFLSKSKVDVRVNNTLPSNTDKHSGIMHNKFAIIDNKTLITGSFNWTHSAEELNNENLLIIKESKELISKFEKEFSKLWHDGKPPQVTPRLDPYNSSELKKHIGEWVIISGKTTTWKVSRSGNLFLDFGEGKDKFTFILWNEGLEELKSRDFNLKDLNNSKIEIKGKLINHKKYGLEITTSNPNAIRIVE